MKIGVLELDIYLDWSFSLKDKRSEANSIIKKIQNKFHITVGQIDKLDNIKNLNLGILLLSNDTSHLDEMIDTVLNFIEENINGEVIRVGREVINY